MPVLNVGSKRVLYIHVPRSGGTFVEALLRSYGPLEGVRMGLSFDGLPCSPQHFHAPLLEHVYSVEDRGAQHAFDYVFMTVRDPLARLTSEYRYKARGAKVSLRRRLTFPRTFAGWVSRTFAAYRRNPFSFDNHIRPQHQFLTFDAEVFRLEDGLERIATVLDELTGVTGELPETPLNDTEDSAPRYEVTAALRRKIETFYADDYRLFGYGGGPHD